MVVFCPAGCKRIDFRTLSVYSTTLSPACFRGFQSECIKRKNSGARTLGSDNTSQRPAKAFRGNHGTGVLVDAAAHLQVCSAFSSRSSFRDHGKAAAKILQSAAAVYHRRTKEITVVRDGFSYAPEIGLLLGFQLGLRIGEICGLKWGDFDLSAGTVTIQRTVTRISCGNGHTKVVVQSPKTQNSHREIPIPKSLLRVLKKLSEDFSSGTWFLSGNEEKPVEPRCYRKSIYGYLKKASVHQAHPHALRHTFATTCLQAHCDIKTLSELLGHADAAVTLKNMFTLI